MGESEVRFPDDAPALSVDMLEALRERWAARGLSIADDLNPGLSTAELDALEAEIECPLGPELRCWWGWQNGEARKESTPFRNRAPGPWFMTVSEALKAAAFFAELDEGEDLRSWGDGWLPVTRNVSGGLLACEPPASADGLSCVRYVQAGVTDLPPDITAGSLGQIVAWWIELYDRDLYYLNDTTDRWTIDASDYETFPGPARFRTYYTTD